MRNNLVGILPAVLMGCLLLPTVALAQGGIAGVVTDSSGGVLPGVTVEAESPVLMGRQTRLLLSFDLLNVFNSAGVLSVNNTYGPVWQNPVGLIAPRLARFSTQVNF